MRSNWSRPGMALAGGFVLLAGAPRASAEFRLDTYAGEAFTDNVNLWAAEPSLRGTAQGMKVDTSLVFGGRVGYWLESLQGSAWPWTPSPSIPSFPRKPAGSPSASRRHPRQASTRSSETGFRAFILKRPA
jgi:hypothetical protein